MKEKISFLERIREILKETRLKVAELKRTFVKRSLTALELREEINRIESVATDQILAEFKKIVPEEARPYSADFPGSPHNETDMFNQCRDIISRRLE
tara:strand:- start:271 stop:561 length:291 start_codon:yes stop_codon:yes gene_type:complete